MEPDHKERIKVENTVTGTSNKITFHFLSTDKYTSASTTYRGKGVHPKCTPLGKVGRGIGAPLSVFFGSSTP